MQRFRLRRLTVALSLAAVLAGVALAGVSGASATPTPFRVLASLPLSGPAAQQGMDCKAGIDAAVAVINKAGGILGHKVEVTYVDDQFSPTVAVSVVLAALSSGTKYNMIFPSLAGATTLPIAAAIAQTPALQLQISFAQALDDAVKYPSLYGLSPRAIDLESNVAAELVKKKVTSIAIVAPQSANGQAEAQALQFAAGLRNIQVTATTFVPTTAVDATAQLQQAVAGTPQAIVLVSFSPVDVAIVKARNQVAATTAMYLDNGAAAGLDYVSTLGTLSNFTEQVYNVDLANSPIHKTANWKTFFSLYNKLDPKPSAFIHVGLLFYNGMMAARAAAVKAHGITPSSLLSGIAKLGTAQNVPGWVGTPSMPLWKKGAEHFLVHLAAGLQWAPAGKEENGGQYVPQS